MDTKQILKSKLLTTKDVEILTGYGRDKSRKLSNEIKVHYGKQFPYSQKTPIRIDHFLEYYKNKEYTRVHSKLADYGELESSILRKPILSIEDIMILTGYSQEVSSTIRKEVLEKYANNRIGDTKFKKMRTDNFIKYYNNKWLTKVYKKTFDYQQNYYIPQEDICLKIFG